MWITLLAQAAQTVADPATTQALQAMQTLQERIIVIATTIIGAMGTAIIALFVKLHGRDPYWLGVIDKIRTGNDESMEKMQTGYESALARARDEVAKAHAAHAETALRSAGTVNKAAEQVLAAVAVAKEADAVADQAEEEAERIRVSYDTLRAAVSVGGEPPPKTRRGGPSNDRPR